MFPAAASTVWTRSISKGRFPAISPSVKEVSSPLATVAKFVMSTASVGSEPMTLMLMVTALATDATVSRGVVRATMPSSSASVKSISMTMGLLAVSVPTLIDEFAPVNSKTPERVRGALPSGVCLISRDAPSATLMPLVGNGDVVSQMTFPSLISKVSLILALAACVPVSVQVPAPVLVNASIS